MSEVLVTEQVRREVVETDAGAIVVETPLVGPQGPRGPAGEGASSYVHNQAAPDDVWAVQHDLGKFPSVTVVDSAGAQVEGSVTFVDDTSLTIEFSAAFSGRAYLN